MRTKSVIEIARDLNNKDNNVNINLVSVKSIINGTKDIIISSMLTRFINHFALSFGSPINKGNIENSVAIWLYIIEKDKSLKYYDNSYEKNKIINIINKNSRYHKLFKNNNHNDKLNKSNQYVLDIGFTGKFSNIVKLDKGTYLYYKYNDKCNITNSENPAIGEFILYFIGKHMYKYFKEFYNSLNSRGTLNDYHTHNHIVVKPLDGGSRFVDKKHFDSLIYDNDTIDTIKKFLIRFDNNYQKYKESNIIYKTGILLYGKPGTGKTSIVKAIASEYDLAILNISPNLFIKIICDTHPDNIRTNEIIENFKNSIFTKNFYSNYDNRPIIVLFDDFDTLFNERDENNVLIVKELLSLLDSIESPENVIFIATTNYIDKIDPAILRAGRFDLKLEIKGLNREGAFKFGKKYNLDDDTINKVLDDYDTDEYIQAELQNKFMNAFVDNINEKG